ncbi:MAG: DUF2130 domain-containing protein [bacterium]|nr:DUF2130 domain-containing protein [bacterium]
MRTIIKCLHCGKEMEITEALEHEVHEQVLREVYAEHSEDLKRLEKSTEGRLQKQFLEKHALELQDLRRALKEKETKVDELREQELSLREEKRKLEEKEKDLVLEIERTLDEERKKIVEEVMRDEGERHRFKEKEKDKVIDDLKRSLEEAQRKASFTSQQLQGEVLELDIEERLSKAFQHDVIRPVAKGARGGDILQEVRNSQGKIAGYILWETKRAKWSPSFLPKLREDARRVSANVSVIVSEEMPKDTPTFGFIDGILVTSYAFALPLAVILRRGIMQVAQAKSATVNKDEKLETLYTYLQSETFRHRFEAYVEGIVSMQQDLETEKRSTLRLWKKREVHITRILESMSSMYGELQGIMGATLSDIPQLSSSQGEDHRVSIHEDSSLI